MNELTSIYFGGLKVTCFEKKQIEFWIKKFIYDNKKKIFFGYSLGTIPLFKKHPEIYTYSNSSDVMVTDGTQFYWLLKLLRYPVKFNLSIPSLVNLTLKIANEECFSVQLFGAHKNINFIATENIKKEYPNLTIYPGISGYFNTEDISEVKTCINKYKPNILLIGIKSPMKEIISHEWKKDISVNIIIPCGGMIDILAGKTKQTPWLLKKIGLATFFRVIQEPKRLFWLNVKLTFEILFRIIPYVLYKELFNKKDYFIPSLYNIQKK